MRSKTYIKRLVVPGMILAVAQAGIAYADAPAPKWYDTIALSGYVQTSYVGNLNAPTDGAGAKVGNTGRVFDTDSNGFNFNAFLLQVAKPVGTDDHYGFTVRLRTGQDATLYPGSGGANFVVQEGYLTYAASSKLSVIGGKFVTPEGYEVVDSIANPNYSLGILFNNAEPVGHTGLKANYTFSDKVNATVGVVNGWDVANPDNNTAKTVLFQVATTPTKQIGWSVQGLYGKELADPSHSQRLSLDTVGTYAVTDKLSLAAQGNWGQETNNPGTNHWVGAGVWASFAETSKCTTSARFEVLEDQNLGARFVTLAGAAPVFGTTGTSNQTVKEFTVTQKHMLTTAMGVRAEYRHDWSNEAYYVKHDGSSVRNQNTLSADWFVTF